MITYTRNSFLSLLVIGVKNISTDWRNDRTAKEGMLNSCGVTGGSSKKSVAGREGGMQDLSHDSESHSLSPVLTYHPVVSPDQENTRQI